jgi:hypothetical protein
MKEKLIKLEACEEVLEWAGDKTWEEIYNTCHRGDWLLWLFAKTNPEDLQLLILAKAHCVNTVRHLMTDKRSRDLVDVGIAFGEGKATIEELNIASYAGGYAGVVTAAHATAKKENQKLTADICRKYLPIEIWNL